MNSTELTRVASPKILLLSLQKFGGGAIDSLEMSNALMENKFFHYILISEGNELIDKFMDSDYRKVIKIKTFASNYLSFLVNTFLLFRWIRVIQVLRKIKPDIVHITHFHIWCIFVYLLRPFFKYKIFYGVHDNPFEPKEEPAFLMNFFEKFLVKKADLISTYSNFMKESIKRYVPNKTIEVLPLGIHSDLCPKLEKKFNLNKESLDVLFFGRLEDYKGIDTLVKAYEILKKENLKIKLTIAGRGKINKDLEHKINELGIIFKNYWISNEELCRLIENCDVLVAPYKNATQSGMVSVALAYGVPIIATNVGSFSEYIKDGVNGFLIDVDDYLGLAEKIKVL
ncbi:glycosyltransferase family 4 protein, partial [Thermocrinis sp.]|uniref:glycosyltransferase family 4 protein n=1 Tax=Thermocrinis sp. TaxID=2024383 RepID=UPI003C00546D